MIETFIFILIVALVCALGGLGYFTIYRLTSRTDQTTSSSYTSIELLRDDMQKLYEKTNMLESRLRAVEVDTQSTSNFTRRINENLENVYPRWEPIPLPKKK